MTENELNTVQDDAVVQIAYNLSVDGEEIESDTLEYLHGYGNIIPGLERGQTGMKVGETKKITALAEDAYGEYDPEQVVSVSRVSFPADFEIRLGEPMRLRDSGGHYFDAIATAISEDSVELDLNHPLAGKDLDFEVTILSIRPATDEELTHGHLEYGNNSEDCSCNEDGCDCQDGSCDSDCCS